MQIEFLVNEDVGLLLCPENPMEEELLKQMLKQDNDITEIRSTVMVLNRTFRNGVFITKKSSSLIINPIEPEENTKEKPKKH